MPWEAWIGVGGYAAISGAFALAIGAHDLFDVLGALLWPLSLVAMACLSIANWIDLRSSDGANS